MALSEEDLAKLQPGNLVIWYKVIYTIQEVKLTLTGKTSLLSFEEIEDLGYFWTLPRDVFLVASSLEAVPLEDWAGLVHLLHPKLKERVEKWLSQKKT